VFASTIDPSILRKRLVEEAGISVSLPPMRFCVDTAAMIAAADSLLAHGHTGGLDTTPNPGLRIEQCQGFSR
jgi:tRNA A37 threonylcarbamoyltransferase TsaD